VQGKAGAVHSGPLTCCAETASIVACQLGWPAPSSPGKSSPYCCTSSVTAGSFLPPSQVSVRAICTWRKLFCRSTSLCHASSSRTQTIPVGSAIRTSTALVRPPLIVLLSMQCAVLRIYASSPHIYGHKTWQLHPAEAVCWPSQPRPQTTWHRCSSLPSRTASTPPSCSPSSCATLPTASTLSAMWSD
jgi:hypothetical protein